MRQGSCIGADVDSPPITRQGDHTVGWQLVKAVGCGDELRTRIHGRNARAFRAPTVMAHDQRDSTVGTGNCRKPPNRIAHQSVGCGEGTACVGRFIPNIEPSRRSDVDIRTNGHHIFDNIARQSAGNWVHPIRKRVIEPSNSAVRSDVHDVGGSSESIHDVRWKASNQPTVSELLRGQIKDLYARWASAISSETNHQFVVVEVHGVEFTMEGTVDGDGCPSGRVKFDHSVGIGCDEQVRTAQEEVIHL